MSEALLRTDFTILHRNMIINLCTTVCDANNESETNIGIRINACKTFLLPLVLVHSIVVGIILDISSTILVMVPVEAVIFGGLDPISLIRSTLAPFLALGLNWQRRYIL